MSLASTYVQTKKKFDTTVEHTVACAAVVVVADLVDTWMGKTIVMKIAIVVRHYCRSEIRFSAGQIEYTALLRLLVVSTYPLFLVLPTLQA